MPCPLHTVCRFNPNLLSALRTLPMTQRLPGGQASGLVQSGLTRRQIPFPSDPCKRVSCQNKDLPIPPPLAKRISSVAELELKIFLRSQSRNQQFFLLSKLILTNFLELFIKLYRYYFNITGFHGCQFELPNMSFLIIKSNNIGPEPK